MRSRAGDKLPQQLLLLLTKRGLLAVVALVAASGLFLRLMKHSSSSSLSQRAVDLDVGACPHALSTQGGASE